MENYTEKIGKKVTKQTKEGWDDEEIKLHKTKSTPVIAFGRDGMTIVFDSIQECAQMFGFKRSDTLKRYIEEGQVLPDGSTFVDYLYTGPSPSRKSRKSKSKDATVACNT